MYVNGQLDGYDPRPSGPSSPQWAYLNGWADAMTFNGLIDEFQVSKIQRSDAEIQAHAQRPVTPLTVDAGSNQTLAGANTARLAGAVSDPDACLSWALVRGPAGGTASFTKQTDLVTKVTFTKPGSYVLSLTATRGQQQVSSQVTITAGSYEALGDSYSAGTGAGDDKNVCRLSSNAYPVWLEGRLAEADIAGSAAFVDYRACVGATAGNNRSKSSVLQQAGSLPDTTTLVTATLGGNDLGFADVMKDCAVYKHNCQIADHAKVELKLQQLPAQVRDVFKQIKAKTSQVVIVGYPHLFPAKPTTSCQRVSPGDQRWLNKVVDELDGVLAARATASRFAYVDSIAAFSGHEVCSADPFINPVVLTDPTASFHPNPDGQKRLADLVEAQVKADGLLP
jgi:lysophospholipase L1-like esterase